MNRVEFRQVKTDAEAIYWHVELYCDEGNMFPVGTAYVVSHGDFAQLNFILVADEWRCRGLAGELLSAIRSKWPEVTATAPMNDTARRLLHRHEILWGGEDVKPTEPVVWTHPSTKLWVRLTLASVIILSSIWLLSLAAWLMQA